MNKQTFLLFRYRAWAHPLSKYPGPWLATISNAYGGLYALMMRLHLATYRDHAQYGSVMRHGPNKLVFNTATALQGSFQTITLDIAVGRSGTSS